MWRATSTYSLHRLHVTQEYARWQRWENQGESVNAHGDVPLGMIWVIWAHLVIPEIAWGPLQFSGPSSDFLYLGGYLHRTSSNQEVFLAAVYCVLVCVVETSQVNVIQWIRRFFLLSTLCDWRFATLTPAMAAAISHGLFTMQLLDTKHSWGLFKSFQQIDVPTLSMSSPTVISCHMFFAFVARDPTFERCWRGRRSAFLPEAGAWV